MVAFPGIDRPDSGFLGLEDRISGERSLTPFDGGHGVGTKHWANEFKVYQGLGSKPAGRWRINPVGLNPRLCDCAVATDAL